MVKREILFLAALTIFSVIFFTGADFYDMPFDGIADLLVLLMQLGVVAVASFLFLWIISCNKYVFSAIFPIYALLGSVAAYFRFTANVTLTPMAIDLALVNDMSTTMDVVTWQLSCFVLMSIVLSVVAVVVRFRYVGFVYWHWQMLASVVVFAAYMSISRFGAPIRGRIPFVIYYAVEGYVENRNIADANRPEFGGTPVCDSDTIDVVFILGETLRAKNMQINNYGRPTTPYLMRDTGVVSMSNIYSEHGFTHTSVPYLLTRANPQHQDRAYRERSFIDIFRQAGFRTTWIANQESVSTFAYFMEEADSLVYVNSGKSMYVFSEWLDGDLLPVLDEQIQSQRLRPRRLFILHTIGSHWWYKSHYPRSFARWKPELKSKVMSANTHDEFVNSYDNTILYSDWFWNEVRNRFRDRNAVVIYLSDHSENLGEDGIYGHAQDAPALHLPGCWVWMSNRYRLKYADKWTALLANKDRRYNSDFLFHSIIAAGDIKTKYIEKQYDIFEK